MSRVKLMEEALKAIASVDLDKWTPADYGLVINEMQTAAREALKGEHRE